MGIEFIKIIFIREVLDSETYFVYIYKKKIYFIFKLFYFKIRSVFVSPGV